MSTNPLLTPRRRREVYLYPGDVEDRIAEYDDAIEAAFAKEGADVRFRGETDKVAQERDAYVEKARADAPRLVLEARTHRELQALYDAHPPRKGDRIDEAVGYNRTTFPPELVRASIVEPKVTEAEWEEFLSEVSAGRMARLQAIADELTGGDVDLGKSSAASTVTRLRAQGTRRRDATE